MAYASLADLKAYIGIPTGTTSDDALLTALLARAQAFIESPAGTGRVFEAGSDTTRYFDAQRDVDGPTLYFDDGSDLCQLTSVVNAGVTFPLTAVATEPRNAKPYFGLTLKIGLDYEWDWDDTPEGAIAVTGRWAYSVTPPTDIVHATIRLAYTYYRQRDNAMDMPAPIISSDGVTIMPTAIPRDVLDTCIRYRRLHG
jgi:hypothetical protein